MLSLIYSVVNYYYECVTQVKNTIINFFEKTPEKGLVENNIFFIRRTYYFLFSWGNFVL